MPHLVTMHEIFAPRSKDNAHVKILTREARHIAVQRLYDFTQKCHTSCDPDDFIAHANIFYHVRDQVKICDTYVSKRVEEKVMGMSQSLAAQVSELFRAEQELRECLMPQDLVKARNLKKRIHTLRFSVGQIRRRLREKKLSA